VSSFNKIVVKYVICDTGTTYQGVTKGAVMLCVIEEFVHMRAYCSFKKTLCGMNYSVCQLTIIFLI